MRIRDFKLRRSGTAIVKKRKRLLGETGDNSVVSLTTAPARGLRPLYLTLGVACVGLGYVGYVVPGMPGTVFLLIALWAFKKSSPRFESWLLNHPWFGSALRDWERDRLVSMRVKVIASTMIWVSVGVSVFLVSNLWVRLILVACALGVTAFLVTRKTRV